MFRPFYAFHHLALGIRVTIDPASHESEAPRAAPTWMAQRLQISTG